MRSSVYSFVNCVIFTLPASVTETVLMQGFTYIAPSVFEEMTKPWRSVAEPRPSRRVGSMTLRYQKSRLLA